MSDVNIPEAGAAPETDLAPNAMPPESPPVENKDEAPTEQKPEEKLYNKQELEERIQARVAKEQRKYERRLEAEVRETRELLKALSSPQAKADVDQKPVPENFKDYSEYVEALTDWKTDQKMKAHLSQFEQSTARAREMEEAHRISQSFSERVDKFTATNPEFVEKVLDNPEIDKWVTPQLGRVLAAMENGPAVALHIAENDQLSAKIARLSPFDAAVELGRISAALSTKPAKQLSSAPAPVKPTVSARALADDLARMSQAEYEAKRAKEGARWSR